jgi:hypothetical protein
MEGSLQRKTIVLRYHRLEIDEGDFSEIVHGKTIGETELSDETENIVQQQQLKKKQSRKTI